MFSSTFEYNFLMRGPAITTNPSKRILMLLHLKAETMYLIKFHKSSPFATLTQMIASSEKETRHTGTE